MSEQPGSLATHAGKDAGTPMSTGIREHMDVRARQRADQRRLFSNRRAAVDCEAIDESRAGRKRVRGKGLPRDALSSIRYTNALPGVGCFATRQGREQVPNPGIRLERLYPTPESAPGGYAKPRRSLRRGMLRIQLLATTEGV